MANIIVRHDGGHGLVRPPREWSSRFALDPLRQLRDLFRWDPFAEMAPAFREREALFAPDFDVKEIGDAIQFRADLPGVEEKDLDVTVTGSRLTIRGKREAEEEQKGETWYTCERSYGSFTRTFTLPDGCDMDHVRASLDKGVLTLQVPKTAQQQAKKITIGGGAAKPKA
jgi:HSP20 family protein